MVIKYTNYCTFVKIIDILSYDRLVQAAGEYRNYGFKHRQINEIVENSWVVDQCENSCEKYPIQV